MPPTAYEAKANSIAYVTALGISSAALITYLLLAPRSRWSTLLFRLNLAQIIATIVHVLVFGVEFLRILLYNVFSGTVAIVVALLAWSAATTLAEFVLLMRVKAVYPDQRYFFRIGVVLILLRTVADLVGRFLFVMYGSEHFVYVLPSWALEAINNIFCTLLFLYRIVQLSESKSFEKTFHYLLWIGVETSLLPTAASLANLVLGILGHGGDGWQVMPLLFYVVLIPAASVWTWRKELTTIGTMTPSSSSLIPQQSQPQQPNAVVWQPLAQDDFANAIELEAIQWQTAWSTDATLMQNAEQQQRNVIMESVE